MFLLKPHALKNRSKHLEGEGKTQMGKRTLNTDGTNYNNDSVDIGNHVDKGQKMEKGKTVLSLGFI